MPVSPRFAKEVNATLVRLGISQREAAKRSRISPGYISNMCLGQVPSMPKVLQFAAGLGVDPTALLTAAGYPQVASPGTPSRAIVRPYASPDDSVPILGEVPGGDWRLAVQESDEQYPLHGAFADITDFCVRVVGHSMYPRLQDGDVVGIKAQATADAGQVVLARLGDEVTVKRLVFEHRRWWLSPYNPDYQPIPVDMDSPDFAIIGIVAWHTHDWLLGDDRVAVKAKKRR